MAMIRSLRKFFQRKRSLDSITLDELRRERIRLEQEEGKLARQVDRLEEQKKQLFLKGKDETSQRRRRILATQIKGLDTQAKNLDRNLQLISRQLRIINGFIQLKENQRLLTESGLSSIISAMDLGTLQRYVERATVDGLFRMDKFQELIGILEERPLEEIEEDRDILEIMRAMEEAKLAEVEKGPEEAEKLGLEMIDKILSREEAEAEV